MKPRTLIAAALMGLLLGIASPVPAAHVTEPQRPIGDLTLHAYRYPDTSTIIPCDGSGVVSWDNLRIEARLTNGSWSGDPAAASEHFTVRLEYSATRPINGRLLMRRSWDALWRHQNIAPHGQVMEIVQSNNYATLSSPGPAQIFVQVVGDETGTVRSITCPFTVAAP